jgi:small subunit ribosomal protein S17
MAQVQEKVKSGVADEKRIVRRTRMAVVEANSRSKTIRVRIDRFVKHVKYGKYQKRRTMLHVHDEKNEAMPGDVVEIMECRPISKTKTWRLIQVLRKAAK